MKAIAASRLSKTYWFYDKEPGRAAEAASHLLSRFPVRDIAIADPPLERVIETLYLQGRG